MCISPVLIRNPYAHRDAFEYRKGKILPMSSRLVSQKANIQVPCGKCHECRKSYFSSIAQRAQMEALTSYVYFITLTYDDDHIPYLEFTSSTGKERIFYSDVRDIQLMFKRLRNSRLLGARDFRYLYAQEFGTLRFRPHHHILLFLSKLPGDDPLNTPKLFAKVLEDNLQVFYSVNKGTRKHPIYEPLFKYAEYTHRNKNIVIMIFALLLILSPSDLTLLLSQSLLPICSRMLTNLPFTMILFSLCLLSSHQK